MPLSPVFAAAAAIVLAVAAAAAAVAVAIAAVAVEIAVSAGVKVGTRPLVVIVLETALVIKLDIIAAVPRLVVTYRDR